MEKPLKGVRVLDLGVIGVGPFSAALLGYLGADVIRAERPEGDYLQIQAPLINGIGFGYVPCNCNKRNILLDLRRPEDKDVAIGLAKRADVLITNTRLGVMDRLGLGYEALSKLNPRLIYCSSTAYGHGGPLAMMGTTDPIMQAYSAFASVNGEPGSQGESMRLLGFLDFVVAIVICESVLVALLDRERTGRGQKIETSHLEASVAFQHTRAAEYFATGVPPAPLGSRSSRIAPSESFRALDNKYFNVSAPSEEAWGNLCRALALERLADDPRFRTNQDRLGHQAELSRLLQEVFMTRPARWWLLLLRRFRVPCGPLNTYDEVAVDPHLKETGMVVDLETPWGPFKLSGIPWEFRDIRLALSPPPRPDSNRAEVLKELDSVPEKTAGETAGFTPGDRPLSGVRVIDLTEGIAGPYCSLQLADWGAEVIKVEPPAGDYSRRLGASSGGGENALFAALNCGKKSLRLDREKGKKVVGQLAAQADVFLVDAGTAAALGLDYRALKRRNPKIVYCSLSDLGESGPYKDRAATELEVQGMMAFQWFLGHPGAPPVRLGTDTCATLAGMHAFTAILAALFQRRHTGQGNEVKTSLLRASANLAYYLAGYCNPDDWVGTMLTSTTDPPKVGFKTRDVPIMWEMTMAGEQKIEEIWRELCRRTGLEAPMDDTPLGRKVRDLVVRGTETPEANELLETCFTGISSDELVRLVDELGGVAAPFNTYDLLFRQPQVVAMDMVREVKRPGAAPLKLLRPPARLSATPWPARTPPPPLGRDTEDILKAAGYAAPAIARLKADKVI